ncbi:hypothetical protein B0H10DRAFT_1947527 [Mycena sp. CBHHK59/15]|nr:hypothetical protein B0H10DRAFT_1947527 [Mycena sp. CBHHK59/15]
MTQTDDYPKTMPFCDALPDAKTMPVNLKVRWMFNFQDTQVPRYHCQLDSKSLPRDPPSRVVLTLAAQAAHVLQTRIRAWYDICSWKASTTMCSRKQLVRQNCFNLFQNLSPLCCHTNMALNTILGGHRP